MVNEAERFLEKCRAISDLSGIQQVLEWDQQVMMPRKGAEKRGHEQATLAAMAHDKLTDPELGDLIESLAARPDLDEKLTADLREARRVRDRAMKIPSALVSARAMACTLAQVAWEQAKRRDDFVAFQPHLARVLQLTKEMAEALEARNPYNALLDEYEPGMTAESLKEIFADLRGQLVRLLDKIQGAGEGPSNAVLKRHYTRAAQEAFGRRIASDMGYDFEAGRMDVSVHPFTSGTYGDTRITTRYDENFLNMSVFGTMHEVGHALYEQGLDPERYRDPSGTSCSLGIHESQSRFWENLIGRSLAFWRRYYPLLRETFPGVLDDVSLEEFYRAINVCEPSLIRVEADEVTYNLHIILRFELESALIAGDLQVADLPQAWREKMRDLLGVVPPTDREGVLQDVHWSSGAFGYFPTYALGNLYAAQFMERIRRDFPDLDVRVGAGDLLVIKGWLNENVHRLGRLYLAPDLCRRITGEPLSAQPSLEYLNAKFAEIYHF